MHFPPLLVGTQDKYKHTGHSYTIFCLHPLFIYASLLANSAVYAIQYAKNQSIEHKLNIYFQCNIL